MHNIIVKTARHVSEKGNQLEIIIKTKQQYNSSFDFLNFDHFLHPYYKHIKQLILSGSFKPQIETQSDEKNTQQQGMFCHITPLKPSKRVIKYNDTKSIYSLKKINK